MGLDEKQIIDWLKINNKDQYMEFQEKSIISAVRKYIDENKNKLLVADEVGLGKTYVAKGIMKVLYEYNRARNNNELFSTLYLAPNEAILEQNIDTLKKNIEECISKAQGNDTERPIKQYNVTNRQAGISILASSPGILFSTKSKYGDKEERKILCQLLNSYFQNKIQAMNGDFLELIHTMLYNQRTFMILNRNIEYDWEKESNNYKQWIKDTRTCIQLSKGELDYIDTEFQNTMLSGVCESRNLSIYNLYGILYKYIPELLKLYKWINPHKEGNLTSINELIADLIKDNKVWNLTRENIEEYNNCHANKLSDSDIAQILLVYVCVIPFTGIVCYHKGENWGENKFWHYSGFADELFSEFRRIFNCIIYKRNPPDFIIVDEFHRYFTEAEKHGINEILACAPNAKVLFLSATPYKMNIGLDEDDIDDCSYPEMKKSKNDNVDNPFEGYADVIKYLASDIDIAKGDEVKNSIADLNKELETLIRISSEFKNVIKKNICQWEKQWGNVVRSRNKLQELLSEYIIRTERYMAYDINENENTIEIKKKSEFKKKEAELFKEIKDIPKAMTYLKHTPHILSFAKDYITFCDNIGDQRKVYHDRMKFHKYNENFLNELFWNGEDITMDNLRLNTLLEHSLPKDIEKILWIPPIRGNKRGVFESFNDNSYTKTLVFCNYVMSARSIAALISAKIEKEAKQEAKGTLSDDEINKFKLEDIENMQEKITFFNQLDNKALENLNKGIRNYFKRYRFILEGAGVTKTEELIKYCSDGCLVELLEEYVNLYNDKSFEELLSVFNMSNCTIKYFSVNSYENAKRNNDEYIKLKSEDKVSCNVASRLTYDFSDSGDNDKDNFKMMKSAFNSPFYPFILASTPMSQEGIDLHYYCHRIMHWNIPLSPIEFEQREGRITRYHSHLVRKRAVELYKKHNGIEPNSWEEAFQINVDKCGIIPNWHIKVKDSQYKTNRILCYQPYSIEQIKHDNLMKALHVYRLSLGYGIDMEKLYNVCDIANQCGKRMEELLINLSPAF